MAERRSADVLDLTLEGQPPWVLPWLHAYAQQGNITAACRVVGVSRVTVWERRKNDRQFDQLVQEAQEIAADALEQEAWRRATEGVKRTRIKMIAGQRIEEVETVYSDRLLIALLARFRPHHYATKHVAMTGQVTHQIQEPEAVRARLKERLQLVKGREAS